MLGPFLLIYLAPHRGRQDKLVEALLTEFLKYWQILQWRSSHPIVGYTVKIQ